MRRDHPLTGCSRGAPQKAQWASGGACVEFGGEGDSAAAGQQIVQLVVRLAADVARSLTSISMCRLAIPLRTGESSQNRWMRIGELSSRSGVSVRSLRYYEAQGLVAPERTTGGQRVYSAQHLTIVMQIQELFHAGFCSSMIQKLLPTLSSPAQDADALNAAFDAATARLISEKAEIEAELDALKSLRSRLQLAPDTHVSVQCRFHDASPSSAPAPFDHRGRRLR